MPLGWDHADVNADEVKPFVNANVTAKGNLVFDTSLPGPDRLSS